MLFFEKENVFMCLVAFQKMFWKIFSGIWLCSWKYHRKHIFYLLLTFSWLPNEYIISFLPQYRNTNKTQKKKKKKIHQIRSNWENKEERGATGFDEGLRSARCFMRSRSTWCFARSRWMLRAIAIDAVLHDRGSAFGSVIKLLWRIGGEVSLAWPGVSWIGVSGWIGVSFGGWALFFLSLSLFYAWPGNGLKVKWKCKTISRSKE